MAYSREAAGGLVVGVVQAVQRAFTPGGAARLHPAYLDRAADRIDLEMRIRELDRAQSRLARYSVTNFAIR